MSSKYTAKLRSAVFNIENDEQVVRRRYVDRFEKIGTISKFYSEDGGLALVNIYRNALSLLETEKAEIGMETYVVQKRKIESEINRLLMAPS